MNDLSGQDATHVRHSPVRLKWLHRVGYVTTTLVAVQILLIVGVICWEQWETVRRFQLLREWSKTQEGPLKHDDRLPVDDLSAYLKRLPPTAGMNGDGFRFVVAPSFSQSDYAFSLSLKRGASQADGHLYTFASRTHALTGPSRAFAVPAWDYRRYADAMDRLTDGWPGADEGCTDGAPVAFERIRGARVTSGRGNCSSHYDRIKRLNLALIRRFAPSSDLPTEKDWYRPFPNDR